MNNKFTMPILTFAAGAIIGAAIVWMAYYKPPKVEVPQGGGENMSADTTGLRLISDTTANIYFKAYLVNFISVDTLKAFSINAQQFNAMNRIYKSDPTVMGFRIYMGKDNLTPVKMVVGFGSPDHTDNIYVTTDMGSGPCPDVCDSDSPIIHN